MAIPRRLHQLAWVVVPVLALAGALYGLLAWTGKHDRHSPPSSSQAAAAAPAAAGEGARMPEAMQLVRARGANAERQIIEAYAAWAKDPAAVNARKFLLGSLFKEPNIAQKLSAVLAAVEADPTPPEADPLWPYLTHALANLWTPETASPGMDLVIAEKRPRARRALFSSFVLVANNSETLDELTKEQRQTLTETMIDMGPELSASQKAEQQSALKSLRAHLRAIMKKEGLQEAYPNE